MKIFVLHGPNLKLLGRREPSIYGHATLAEIDAMLAETAVRLNVTVDCAQSDSEGELVQMIGSAPGRYDGLLLNPAAYTHTSVALYDAIRAAGLPCVEVHLSNPSARESFRRRSFTAPACLAQVAGFGSASYRLALEGLVGHLLDRRTPSS